MKAIAHWPHAKWLVGTEEVADGFAIMFSHSLGMEVIIGEQGVCQGFSILTFVFE